MRWALVVALGGCAGSGGDDTELCETALRVCVTMEDGGAGLADARVDFRRAGEDTPIEALADADGCAELTVDPGSWEWRGRNAGGDCVSTYEPIEAVECETAMAEVALLNWCMDGR